jgi:hypothetical protein
VALRLLERVGGALGFSPEGRAVRIWTEGRPGEEESRVQEGVVIEVVDGGALVELDALAGGVRGEWPLAGVPDATFFNPASGLVHVAIGDPGLIQSIDPRTGASHRSTTAVGAKTTALVAPDRLYVFSPAHRGSLVLAEA